MRDWLRLLPKRFYYGLPATGYFLSLLAAVLLSTIVSLWPRDLLEPSGVSIRFIEVAYFLALPALFALAHLLAPRTNWASKTYRLLTTVWLGAVFFGALCYVPALERLSPWLSWARHLLIGAGALLIPLSMLVLRPFFSAASWGWIRPRRVRAALWIALGLTGLIVASSLVFMVAPNRLVRAPRATGLHLQKIGMPPAGLSCVAWSPDSQRVLVEVYVPVGRDYGEVQHGGYWLISLDGRHIELAKDGEVSSQPWLFDGSGLLFSRGDDIWWQSADGKRERQLSRVKGLNGPPLCSPAGPQVAFLVRNLACVSGLNFASPRGLAGCDCIGEWSPDGKSLVIWQHIGSSDCSGQTGSVVPAAGGGRSWFPKDEGVGWLTGQELFSVSMDFPLTDLHNFLHCPFSGPEALEVASPNTSLVVRDLQGSVLRRYSYGNTWALDIESGGAPSPDGKRVAVATEEPHRRIYFLDTRTGRASWFPSDFVSNLCWSPDGKKLAFRGVKDLPGSTKDNPRREEYLGIVTGL